MSYINDALRKAQQEKDNRYRHLGGLAVPDPDGAKRPRRRRVMIASVAAAVVAASAALLFAIYGRQAPPARPEAASPAAAVAAETPAAKVPPLPVRSPAGPPETPRPEARRHSSAQPPAGSPSGPAAAEKPAPSAEKTVVRPPDGSTARPDAEARYREALAAQRAGELRQAEELYRKVLALDPAHVRTLNNLGVVYMEQKQREKAIATFGRAVVLKKDYVDPYYNLACLYAQTGEIDESLWYLKVAVKLDGRVIEWVKKDADMKNVAASAEFKKIMEGQKN